MACAFDKLAQRDNLLICSALFVVGQLIVSLVLREIIITFNVVFKNLIIWPSENKMEMVMQASFKILCGPPSLRGPLMVHIFLSLKLMEFYVKITFITKQEGIMLFVK